MPKLVYPEIERMNNLHVVRIYRLLPILTVSANNFNIDTLLKTCVLMSHF